MDSEPDTIADLKTAWDGLQPLSKEAEKRLWTKLRMEWNYHSNHIEGNTLTYGETELLLIHGETLGNHSLREYEEMKAHDLGIGHLRELAADTSRPLQEADVRNLIKIILKEPFWKEAVTHDGQPTRKQIMPGEYKNAPNNVRTATGEIFEFAPPADVPARMRRLMEWLNKSLSAPNLPLLPLLAKLHHEFVLIHPFDDGNGRVARLLVNYTLLRLGYVPIIIPTERKKEYLTALRRADAGELRGLEAFLEGCLKWSLKLGIRAGKGESLEEPGDIDKEIAVFSREQEHHRGKVLKRSKAAIEKLHDLSFKDLILSSMQRMTAFDSLFLKSEVSTNPGGVAGGRNPEGMFRALLASGFEKQRYFQLQFTFEGYTGETSKRFGVTAWILITFRDFDYTVHVSDQEVFTKLYSEPLLKEEQRHIIETMMKKAFATIRKRAGRSSNPPPFS